MDDRPTKSRLREPSAEAIQCGYYLTKARKAQEEAVEFLTKALYYGNKARDQMVAEGVMYFMETSPGFKKIGEAIAGSHSAGAAHDELRRLMKEHGYRDITNEDFATYGAGGGR
jgi:hypothetical protein